MVVIDLTECEDTIIQPAICDNPIPIFNEEDLPRLLAEEWVQRSQEFGERSTCINQDLLFELGKCDSARRSSNIR